VLSTSLFLAGHFAHAGFGLRQTDPVRSWAGLPCQTDPATEIFFNASIVYVVGNEKSTLFWSDPWLEDKSFVNLMPELVEAVPA
jgi:hypothetical protein